MFFIILVGLSIIVFHVLFSGVAQVNLLQKLIFSLGAHVAHVPDVLGTCDIMSIWSCICLQCHVGHMCWAYVMCDVHNNSMIKIAR